MLKELVAKNRSYRRFDSSYVMDESVLRDLVDLARLSPTGRNIQSLKFMLSCDPAVNAVIYEHLGWAGYLKDWEGPQAEERPTAYITILNDKEISPSAGCDHGIAAQSILLGAVERGLGGCMIATVRRVDLMRNLNIPEKYEILLVIALGKPVEIVCVEPVQPDGDIRYWRDEEQIHPVPKRSLDDLILK